MVYSFFWFGVQEWSIKWYNSRKTDCRIRSVGIVHYAAAAAQMKEMDRIAIQERGIPSLELMENAARAVAREVVKRVGPPKPADSNPIARAIPNVIWKAVDGKQPPEERREAEELRQIVESKNMEPAPRIGVFCGPGNNGGDGVAAARILLEAGYRVRAFLVGERAKMTPDERAMEEKLLAVGGNLEPFDPQDRRLNMWLSTCGCLVDALFGVGLKRPLEGIFRTAVEWMNRSGCPVVACDLPSGVDGDTGKVLGTAVRATVTVTFTCPKPGLYMGEGAALAGKVWVENIGIPMELVYSLVGKRPDMVEIMPGDMRCVLPPRPAAAHKGNFGKLFLLAGSEGYTGAPVLAARAALRTGAGLVFLGVPRSIYPIVAVKCDEAMPFPLPERYEEILKRAASCDVVLIGPGLGQAPETRELVLRLLEDLDRPVVLDADGINALVGHIDSLDKRRAPTILTPHAGEFARLTGNPLPIENRLSAARDFAMAHSCTLVLKGRGTVTAAPNGQCWICGTGNPGMAKGGSGDVLSGMIAAILGQKYLVGPGPEGIPDMTAWAVWFHGKAGDRCAQRLGEYAMLPGDLVETLPEILKENQMEHP